MRPSLTTMTRSLRRMISGSSDETTTIALPARARASIRSYTSCFAPASMPRVGSSRMMTSQSAINQRAIIAFCWLPPLNFRISRSICIGRSATRLRMSVESARMRDRERMPRRANRRRMERLTLAVTDRKGIDSLPFRSSGTRPIPCRAATARDRKLACSPRRWIVPASGFSTPASKRTISVRPAPTSPAMPRTSPRLARTAGASPRPTAFVTARSRTSGVFPTSWIRDSWTCIANHPLRAGSLTLSHRRAPWD